VWITEETALAQGLSDFFPLSLKSTSKGLCAAFQRSGFAYGHCHKVEDVLRIIFASRLIPQPPLTIAEQKAEGPLGAWNHPADFFEQENAFQPIARVIEARPERLGGEGFPYRGHLG
jgi:hypothetical protein